ncbi:MAG: hypothetical protein WA126_11490 [Thermodesulfovibrionales bacterium]
MFKHVGCRVLVLSVLFILTAAFSAYAADPSTSLISGRLAATYDNKAGTVTAMVAGYCESQPVTIGPVTWAMTEQEFSNADAENIAQTICGKDHSLRKVVKTSRNGRDMIAEVIIDRTKP